MPALVTHYIYSQKMVNKSETSYLHQVVNKYKNVFNLGAQGPDLFLFYHKIPLIQSDGAQINKLGSRLHIDKVNELLSSLITQAKDNMNEILISYVAGFLTHHALDSQTHPFVIYSTGSPLQMSKYAHVMFENQIDIGVLQENKLTMQDVVPYKLVKTTKQEKKTIANLLVKALKEAFSIEISTKIIDDCMRDILIVERILYDKTGKKVAFLEKLESLLHCEGLATSMVVPTKYDDVLDAMNYRQDSWCNPTSEKMVSYESFLQMGQKAIDLGKKELETFENYLLGKQELNDLIKIIGGRSYETNVDVNVERVCFKQ